MSRLARLSAWVLLLAALGCTASPSQRAEAPEPPAEAPAARAGAVSLASVRGVAFATVRPPEQEWAWFAAEAVGDASQSASVTAPLAGIVVELAVEPGRPVAQGQPVAVIRSPELAELKARWAVARAQAQRAVAERQREERLFAAGATSERELEAARLEERVRVTEEDSARLDLEARGVEAERAGALLEVRAPKAGVLEPLGARVGQGVVAGQELARVVAPGAAQVLLELPPPGAQGWQPGAETEVRHSDGRRWRARVEGLPAALSESSRRLQYRLRLTDSQAPLAGTPLEVRVPLAKAIVLPQTALQQIEGVWGVYVREADSALFRPVSKGAELGGDVLVLEGVAAGEEVAVEGAYLLKSLSLKASGGGEDHEH